MTAQSSPKEEFLFSALSPTHTLPDAQKKGRRMSFLYDSHLLCMNLLFSAVCEILPFSRSKSLFLRCKFLLQIFYCSFLFFRIKPHHRHVHHVRHQDDRDCQVCQDAVHLLDQRQQTSAARIWVRLILPAVSVLLLRSARPAWIRLTMAATMLTAVDTAPRMISTEISGVMNLLPTPC